MKNKKPLLNKSRRTPCGTLPVGTLLIWSVCLACAVALTGCSSKPVAVNRSLQTPYLMSSTTTPQGRESYGAQPKSPTEGTTPTVLPVEQMSLTTPESGISGQVLSKSDFPRPLSRISIGLFQILHSGPKLISSFTSETNGGFRVTQPLFAGSYELRVLDPRYEGVLPLTLDRTAVNDIHFEISPKQNSKGESHK